MRWLLNLKLAYKIFLPVVLLFAVAIGITVASDFALDQISSDLRKLVDVDSRRRTTALELSVALNEATLQEKNAILESAPEEVRARELAYRAAGATATQAAEQLVKLSDNAERRSGNEQVLQAVRAYLATADKSVEASLRGDDKAALQISLGPVRDARRKVSEMVNDRVQRNAAEMEVTRDQAIAAADRTSKSLMIGAGVAIVVVAAALGLIVLGLVTRPLARMVDAMSTLARGDLDVTVEGDDRNDELGTLAGALAIFRDNAREVRRLEIQQAADKAAAEAAQRAALLQMADDFERSVGRLVEGVAAGATQMESAAQSLAATAEQTTRQSTVVAAAAEEASGSVSTVASAAEELSSSIGEIARQVQSSADVAQRAVAEVTRTDATVESLAETAQQIGDVLVLIEGLAAQTNLLALNATIEAARAGDAGKGFAVVASEVKTLAGQTARATDEIKEKIEAIQAVTRSSVEAIRGIGTTIVALNEISSAIAAAVEEQGAATGEIASNVQQTSLATREISGNISGVSTAAQETGANASQVLSAAASLLEQSGSLRTEVATFLATVRAA